MHGRRFGAIAKVSEKKAIQFLRNNVIPATKRTGAALFESAAAILGEILGGRKSFNSVAENVERQTLRKLGY